jgi:oligoendopeptidase F
MPLPTRWDLTALFPDFAAPEVARFEAELRSDVDLAIADAARLPDLSPASDAAWTAAIVRYESVVARLSHLSTYVSCLGAAHASDTRFAQAEARLGELRAQTEKFTSELRRALRSVEKTDVARLAAQPELVGAAFFLEQSHVESRTSMRPDLEGLAADLGTDGLGGWSRLYDVVSAKLELDVKYPDGRIERVPMAQRRSLMADSDRRVRQAAFAGGNVAWERVGDVTAAALNHIAGVRHTLNARRGVEHFLDVALHQAAISKKTLDAMMSAVRGGRDLARRGLRLKARAMGLPAIDWCDLEAPLPVSSARRIPLEEGVDMVRGAFGQVYPALAAHVDTLFQLRHVETEARPDKRPGAFCAPSDLTGDALVFMTYQGSLGDVSTLAHEIGHAFHAETMRGLRPFALHISMPLAETASTFAEAVLSAGLMRDPKVTDAERALLLGEVAGDAAAFLLDVPARFEFERAFYEERRGGEVSAARLCELMVAAQREVFGDALREGGEDPWFWASKLHFYIPDITFYNFPYTFGFLLSRGMAAELEREGPAFLPKYEAFLRASGSGYAHEVAKSTVGRDLESPEFWASAVDTLRAPLDELERLLPKVITPA